MRDVLEKSHNATELLERIAVARFLCEKAKSVLMNEMPFRGATDTLVAFNAVEKLEQELTATYIEINSNMSIYLLPYIAPKLEQNI